MGSPSILDDLDAYAFRPSGPFVLEATRGIFVGPGGPGAPAWVVAGKPRGGVTPAGGSVRWWVPLVMPGVGGG